MWVHVLDYTNLCFLTFVNPTILLFFICAECGLQPVVDVVVTCCCFVINTYNYMRNLRFEMLSVMKILGCDAV
jgi:hypothetical protein